MDDTGMDALRKCGVSFSEIARRLRVTRGAIYQWDRVPAERLGELAEITGLAHHVMRPDLFPVQPERSTSIDQHDLSQDADRVSPAGAACDLVAAPALSHQEAAE